MTANTTKAKSPNVRSLSKKLKESAIEINERISSVEKMVGNINENIDKVMAQMETLAFSTLAKNRPTSFTKDGAFSEDVYLHEDEVDIEFKKNSDPMADVEAVRPAITSIHNAEFKAKADQMRFDKENIEIMVMPSSSTYPDHTFTVGVNGRIRLIVRGIKMWIPRNYVEVLLRAKISTYGNYERRNEMTNELEVKNPEVKSHRYPLQVLTDNNPLGASWLQRVSNDVRA